MTEAANSGQLRVIYHRGSLVESVHEIAALVTRAGKPIKKYGDTQQTKFCLRSAAKIFQALVPLKIFNEHGFKVSERELAIIASSHFGSDDQVALVQSLLKRGCCSPEDLLCGHGTPLSAAIAESLIRKGQEFSLLHNNCSGKHSAMLIACKLTGYDMKNYTDPGHPLQQQITQLLADLAGIKVADLILGTDGCGVPAYGMTLTECAQALNELLRRAAKGLPEYQQLLTALINHPQLLFGPGAWVIPLYQKLQRQFFIKDGAEGYAVLLAPDQQLAITVKVKDGAQKALKPALAYLIGQSFSSLTTDELTYLKGLEESPIFNLHKHKVGQSTVAG